jgi:hypothetical protein
MPAPGVICTLADGTYRVTDLGGMALFSDITGPQTITFSGSRYIATTIYHINANTIEMMLDPVSESGYFTGTVRLIINGLDSDDGDSNGIVRSRGDEMASFSVMGPTSIPSTLIFPVFTDRAAPLEVYVYDNSGTEVKSGQTVLWFPFPGDQYVTVDVMPADEIPTGILTTGYVDNSAISKFTPEYGFSGSHALLTTYTPMHFAGGTYDFQCNTFGVYLTSPGFALSQSVYAGLGDSAGNRTYRQFNGFYATLAGQNFSGELKDIPEIAINLNEVSPNGSVTWNGVVGSSRYVIEMVEKAEGKKWRAIIPGGTTSIDIPDAAGIVPLRNYTVKLASETYDNLRYNWYYSWQIPALLTHRSETALLNMTTSGGGPGGGPIQGELTIIVTNEFTRLPIKDVMVSVEGIPSLYFTNASGIALVNGVSGPQTVTFYEPDYEGLTIFNIDAETISMPLTPMTLAGVPLANFEINITEFDCTSDAYTLYLNDVYAEAGMVIDGRPSPDDPIPLYWPAGGPSHFGVFVYDNSVYGPTRYGYTLVPASTVGTNLINIVPMPLASFGSNLSDILGAFDISGISGFTPDAGTVEAFSVVNDGGSVFTGAADYFTGNGFFAGGIFKIPEGVSYRLEAAVEDAAGQFSARIIRGDYTDFAYSPLIIVFEDIPTATSSFSSPPATMPISWTAIPGTSYYAIAIDDGAGFFWYGLVPGHITSITVPYDAGLIPGESYGCSIEAHVISNFDFNQFTPLSLRENRESVSIWVFGGTFTVSF